MTRRRLFQLAGGVLAPLAAARDQIWAATFRDVTVPSGLGGARNVSGGARNKQLLLEEMGCGVALFDFDNDGWIDIFLVNATQVVVPAGVRPPTSYLFRNNRDGTFRDVTVRAGLTRSGWGQGCCAGDYDNDGHEDLFVSYWGRNALYRNRGDGTFEEVSVKAGVAGSETRWGAGCCFLDFDRDGLLDLFVSNYVAFDAKRAPKPGSAPYCRFNEIPVPCGPQGFAGGTNALFRNRGDGTFEDVSEKSGIATPRGASSMTFVAQDWRPSGSYGMGAVAADLDNDGWPDIYVSCDSAPSLMYRNNHDGTFTESAVPAGSAFDENGAAMSGMGVSAADYDNDGSLDLVRTNFSDQVTTLYRNNGDGTFEDASLKAGFGVNRKFLGFGALFLDYDNDGLKDVLLANGHVYSQIADRGLYLEYKQPRTLYRNRGGGKFDDVSTASGAGINTPALGRGSAAADLDNDGDLDAVINNLDAPPSVLRNEGGNKAGNWLLIRCVGSKSNRSGIGTRVKVLAAGVTQTSEVISGSSYYSHSDLRLHFGLAAAKTVDRIELAWPSGLRQKFEGEAGNQLLVIHEEKGIVAREPFRVRAAVR